MWLLALILYVLGAVMTRSYIYNDLVNRGLPSPPKGEWTAFIIGWPVVALILLILLLKTGTWRL